MKFNLKISICIVLFVASASTWSANAQTDLATFEILESDSKILWWLAFRLAIVGGGLLFFSGGTATPAVAGIGTWIGGLMGLSGIAATNAGLALLGGGAIASGGFGVIGGATLLTAAWTLELKLSLTMELTKRSWHTTIPSLPN